MKGSNKMKKKTITVLVVLVFIGIASFSLYPEYQSYMETKIILYWELRM